MVIFDDLLDAEETALKIKRLRQELNKSAKFEFKFNKSSSKYRTTFLEEIGSCKFRVRAVVFRKELIYSLNLRGSKEKFYNFAVKSVLEHNNDTIRNAKIRIDASSDKNFKQNLKVYLRQQLNLGSKKITKDIKFRDSTKDNLIQLADMVAGSINRYYQIDKNDRNVYLKIITDRVEDIWEFM